MMSPLFDPEIESKLCSLLLVMTLVFVLFIVLIAFVTVRVDGIVDWSWSVVWIPAWILNIFLFGAGTLYRFQNNTPQKPDDEEKQTQRNNNSTVMIKRAIWILNTVLFVLFQIFVILRLDGIVSWTASVVFIPYFIFEGVHVLVYTVIMTEGLFSVLWWSIAVRACLVILVVLRIDKVITCSWGIVFIPLYLVGIKWALALFLKYRFYAKMTTQPEVAHQGKVTVLIYTVLFVVLGLLFYTLIGLIARRLDGIVYINMSHVFVPFFLVFVSSDIIILYKIDILM